MEGDNAVVLKAAIRERGSLKAKLTRFKTFIEKFNENKDFFQLKHRVNQLTETYTQFEIVQTRIESLVADDIVENEQIERGNFEELYFEMLANADRLLQGTPPAPRNSNLDQPGTSQQPVINNVNATPQIDPPANVIDPPANVNELTVKLPTMHLPKFSGSYEGWSGFCDAFKSAIHHNPNFRDAQKLMYLRSCLSGKAAEKIESLETTCANYTVAWSILERYYNDPTAVINSRIKALFNIPACSKPNAVMLGEIADAAVKHYRALQALNKPFLEAFPIYAIISKLDEQTQLKWRERTQDNESPTMDDLLKFLHSQQKLLETTQSERTDGSGALRNSEMRSDTKRGLNKHNKTTLAYAQTKAFCHLCKKDHFTQNCDKLVNVDVRERIEIVKGAGLCYNCLKANHSANDCKSSNCKRCKGRHHTLLHVDNQRKIPENNPITTGLHAAYESQTLLSTAIVHIIDSKGLPRKCRVLLDSGSQSHFITEQMAREIGLNLQKMNIEVAGLSQVTTEIKASLNATIKSRLNEFSTELKFLVIPKINDNLPSRHINQRTLKIPSNIVLADPEFYKPSKLDAIIGAELFFNLLCIGQISMTNKSIILQKTRLGWIIAGNVPSSNTNNNITCNFSLELLNKQMQKFWEVEEGPKTKFLSAEENSCEIHYQQNTMRDDSSGRYIVRLPFNDNKNKLGESYNIAIKRLFSMERKFRRQGEFKNQYVQFLREYENLKHMREILDPCTTEGCYLPHHAILKESSLTTKLRVVFDGSVKTSTNISLNDTLLVGPVVQNDLFAILIRFRSYIYVLTADVTKMYRQTLVHPDDRRYQKIVWRENEEDPIKTYELNTVTYGTSAASYLATRSLVQLTIDEGKNYPLGAISLRNDVYVDDILTGSNTIEETKKIRDELVQLTKKGGLELCKWASNESKLIKPLANHALGVYLSSDISQTVKTLGVSWNAAQDVITPTPREFNQNDRVTKRTILSDIAQLFDPLGLLGPIIVFAKVMMQKIWRLKLSWDESIPNEIHTSWISFKKEFSLLSDINIPRKIISENHKSLQLHGFCDASELAYGACIYIRSTDESGKIYVQLVCSKSRIAPLKTISLPRLELCAALLLAKLYTITRQALSSVDFDRIVFWSDSTISLCWINSSPHTLQTFVANRVTEIQSLTSSHQWRHVQSKENPADAISRGQTPKILLSNSLWYTGPSWLGKHEGQWPETIIKLDNIPEIRRVHFATREISKCELIDKFSSLNRLKRVFAYCLRFLYNCTREAKVHGVLSVKELETALIRIIKIVQNEMFFDEINILKSGNILKGKMTCLNPFIDSAGIVRVGGRLERAEISQDGKYPIILPKGHHFTNLVIQETHIKHFHSGTQATLAAIRQCYWIIDGRNAVKNIIHKCVTCARAKPKIPIYQMGNLPSARVNYIRPFLQSGVDYCGPFYIKEKRHRNRNKIKVYIVIFVCFATKAVHLEIASDLTTEAFLAALKRFFSRRGKSTDIYSDNASNFVGAKAEICGLNRLVRSDEYNETVTHALANESVNWHFIPPRSPHFGGLWEAAVKSFKNHFSRVVGNTLLDYEVLLTLVTQIEAILNSRPLTPLSPDPNDFCALTPGHFLIGDSMTNIPEPCYSDLPSGRLSSWQHAQQLRQHFWSRWQREYLHEQTVRKKWHTGSAENISIGTLVTLVENNEPPLHWSLGRIIEIHPGDDGIIRTATVKTAQGTYKRCVKKLAPLPIETSTV